MSYKDDPRLGLAEINGLLGDKRIIEVIDYAPDNGLIVYCRDHLKRLIRFNTNGSIIWIDSYNSD
jgi:hypothetical protein